MEITWNWGKGPREKLPSGNGESSPPVDGKQCIPTGSLNSCKPPNPGIGFTTKSRAGLASIRMQLEILEAG
jgi:hypothetical protein